MRPAGTSFAKVLERSREGAAYLAQSYALGWAMGLENVCWCVLRLE
jgi:hypothetical protein